LHFKHWGDDTMNADSSGEAVAADRGALGLIGLMLATATVVVAITAAVAVSDYPGDDVVANLPVAANATTIAH
jgi:hypothetical protein